MKWRRYCEQILHAVNVGYDLRGSHHFYDCNFKPKSIISYKIYRNVYVLSPCHISLNLAPVIFLLRTFQLVQLLALGYRTAFQFHDRKGNFLLCTASGLAPVFLLVLVSLSLEMKRRWIRQVTSVWRHYYECMRLWVSTPPWRGA